MANEDTIRLLRECNAGIKMGVASIDEVLERVQNPQLAGTLTACKDAHEKLGNETKAMLAQIGVKGKEPNPAAKSMSWIKTNVMMTLEHRDQTVADLIIDGCDMGVKSLSRYLNQYPTAEPAAKDITGRLIQLEAQLSVDLRPYL